MKNRNLGFEVPCRHGSKSRTCIPDYIIQMDDGHGADDPFNLVVEIKGYRGEDAREKANAMKSFWVPGINRLKAHGRRAFAESTDIWAMKEDFAQAVEAEFGKMIENSASKIESLDTALDVP